MDEGSPLGSAVRAEEEGGPGCCVSNARGSHVDIGARFQSLVFKRTLAGGAAGTDFSAGV